MAIPVARVHLAMAHAALPGLLPSPPKCAMLPLLPAPPCAATTILPNNSSPPRPSRADAAGRWDAHKTKPAGGSPAPPPPSDGVPGRSSSCEKWVSSSNNKKIAGAGAAASSSSSNSSGGADSDERWDANKKPASAASCSSSSSSASRNTGRGSSRSKRRRATSRAASSSSGERWDAHKNGRRAPRIDEFVDDGGSSAGSDDVELDKQAARTRALYAGPGFMASPEPSMLPMPSFMVRVAA
ncbi:unnamed protein product [Urochloa humidicola]